MATSGLAGDRTLKEAAEAFHVCVNTASQWVRRYRHEGTAGMVDRSSRPKNCPRQIRVSATANIEVLRRQRLTGRQIAERVGIGKATIHRVLDRRGLTITKPYVRD